MRNIIKVLLNEGIEREDVVAICKYIKEEYEVNEELISETKKANKIAHQEAIFRKLNPGGVGVTVHDEDIDSKGKAEAKSRLKDTLSSLDGATFGITNSMADFKKLTNADKGPQDSPYRDGSNFTVREILGRDNELKK